MQTRVQRNAMPTLYTLFGTRFLQFVWYNILTKRLPMQTRVQYNAMPMQTRLQYNAMPMLYFVMKVDQLHRM